MDIALLVITLVVIAGFARGGDTHGFCIEQTTTVNGLFVLLVCMSHFEGYYGTAKQGLIYPLFQSAHGQLIVVPFFLFSGYGIMSSIKKKGEPYVANIAKQRAPKLLLRFDVCVMLFVILNIILNIDYGIGRTILAFTTLVDIGNSNWFITTTLVTYLLVAVVFTVDKRRGLRAIMALAGLLVLYAVVCIFIGAPSRFYNTVLAFPVGMMLCERNLAARIPSIRPMPFAVLLLLMLALSVLPKLTYAGENEPMLFYLTYTVRVLAFCIVLIFVFGRFGFRSRLLRFFGSHVFSIYMLQRLVMIPIFQFGILASFVFARLLVALALTVVCALMLERLFAFIDQRLF